MPGCRALRLGVRGGLVGGKYARIFLRVRAVFSASAWMHEVGQRMEQLPMSAWMHEVGLGNCSVRCPISGVHPLERMEQLPILFTSPAKEERDKELRAEGAEKSVRAARSRRLQASLSKHGRTLPTGGHQVAAHPSTGSGRTATFQRSLEARPASSSPPTPDAHTA